MQQKKLSTADTKSSWTPLIRNCVISALNHCSQSIKKIKIKVVGALRLRMEEFKLNYLLEKNIS